MNEIHNPWDGMRAAIAQSRSVLHAADSCAADAARLIVGRLRFCSPLTLKELKRELRDFNIHTGQWKDR